MQPEFRFQQNRYFFCPELVKHNLKIEYSVKCYTPFSVVTEIRLKSSRLENDKENKKFLGYIIRKFLFLAHCQTCKIALLNVLCIGKTDLSNSVTDIYSGSFSLILSKKLDPCHKIPSFNYVILKAYMRIFSVLKK